MYWGPKALLNAVERLSRLPGIGEKTAHRLVLHLIHSKEAELKGLEEAIGNLREGIRLCSLCCGLTDEDPCPLCTDPARDSEVLCVVEAPNDLFSIERSGEYRGLYHVLHGCLSPLDGVGPEQLKVTELYRRVDNRAPREVLLATNPDVEGEATALYLAKGLKQRGVRTTRIALGLPMGAHVEHADRVTLARAISERRQFEP